MDEPSHVPCPVCTGRCKVRRRFIPGPDREGPRVLDCITVRCRGCNFYRLTSSYGHTVEAFGMVAIQETFGEPDLPGMPLAVRKLESYQKLRRTLMTETRAIWGDRVGRTIVESMNAARFTDRVSKLIDSFNVWVGENRDRFPLHAEYKSSTAGVQGG